MPETMLPYLLTFLFIITISFIKIKSKKNIASAHKENTQIPPHKIIIGLEIKDFLVEYSGRYKNGFIPIENEKQEISFWRKVLKLVGYGHFYRKIFSHQKIKKFIKELKNISNIELFIYTTFSPEILTNILHKLRISEYFPSTHRKFCAFSHQDTKKHGVDIDGDTRRVIILTPSHEDYVEEDEKYFLVLKGKMGQIDYLNNCLKIVRDFVEETTDINDLHERLLELKVSLELAYD